MIRSRRSFLAAALAAPLVLRARPAAADTVTIRIGALKLIHSITPWFYERFVPAGYRVEIIPFESPTDGKSAVVTKSVDFGTFGIAAGDPRRRRARAGRGVRIVLQQGHGGGGAQGLRRSPH